ncbi:MAG: hypothetical protein PHF40_01715 [Candidatus Pacebacteria bacterium]|nr:hypothetical protein [Candidatus Paceibacterota bacterium]
MKNLNNIPQSENSREKIGLENIEATLKENAAELRKMGIPVDDESRLQIEGFKNYPKEMLIKDKIAEDRFKERFGFEHRSEQVGEQFEKLKTALLQKSLKKKFVVCRTAFFDDVVNGVDNIILDRQSGNIVCALDEVCDVHSKRYEEKRAKVLEINRIGGAKINYGIELEPKTHKIKLSPISEIPLFFLGLNDQNVKKIVKQFEKDKTSEMEKNIIRFFAESMKQQAELFLNVCPKNTAFTQRLRDFQKTLTEFNQIKDEETL